MAVRDAARHDVVDRVPRGLYVGGRWSAATGGRTPAVQDPGEYFAVAAE